MKKRLTTTILALTMALGLATSAGAAMGDPENLSASGGFTAAVDENGTLYTWGTNTYGQLGSEDLVKVNGKFPDQNFPLAVLEDVQAVALGDFHGAAVKTDGTLWTWGCNDNGQVGKKRVNDKYVMWYKGRFLPRRIVTP